MPDSISKQLLDIRQRLKDLQVNDTTWELNDTRHRMKDPFEVLRNKEMELFRVRQEVESLRLVIPLLVEDMEETETTPSSSTTENADAVARKAAQPVPRRHCVECPDCHTRYIIGFSPYGNGSYLAKESEDADLFMLFCSCSTERGLHPFKMSTLKMYVVTPKAHERGYGSPDEIVLAEDETRKAS